MIDYATELRRLFVKRGRRTVNPTADQLIERAIAHLERERAAKRKELEDRGMLIIKKGNTFRPSWGEPDPRFASYAEAS